MNQICKKCNIEKHPKAFLGGRLVCRACWIYLTPEEKEHNHVVPKHIRDKNAKYQRERISTLALKALLPE